MTELTTARLRLTPMTVADFEDLCRLWRDPAFTRQIGLPFMLPETVWLRLLRDIGHWQIMGVGNWAIRRREDDAWLGTVGIFDYRRDLVPAFGALEVGWGLVPAFHGQGYAFEAVTEALRYADDDLRLPRTTCMIAPDNAASFRLAAKVGFTPWVEGDLRGEKIQLLERFCK
ncbi:acetyltransferase GNAT family protein [Asticcacaulis biprosthecium C19]|uniref:Acetyltransferase GNAT family protein n=1 Tax=Asticcacaulis biprosthecium C19 TaxID=715226 RepID=F4QIH4_9CAUL|nr:GNAT family N-acetyltransferase [Asticcacaulis biprosthecium]EGF92963.1 acetyltransferase GNAT family protein [Asticcacaulis biprosthecium C19]